MAAMQHILCRQKWSIIMAAVRNVDTAFSYEGLNKPM